MRSFTRKQITIIAELVFPRLLVQNVYFFTLQLPPPTTDGRGIKFFGPPFCCPFVRCLSVRLLKTLSPGDTC